MSFFAAKNSPLTPFFAHGIRKMTEAGIINIHAQRNLISEPNCKPLQTKGRPLGLEKLAFLFAFYATGCIISLIILVMENIVKHSKPISPKESPDESMIWQKIESSKEKLNLLQTMKKFNFICCRKLSQVL